MRQISSGTVENRASILVFNHKCHPFKIREDPAKIDVNCIQFPDGGTDPGPTFIEAAKIIHQVI